MTSDQQRVEIAVLATDVPVRRFTDGRSALERTVRLRGTRSTPLSEALQQIAADLAASSLWREYLADPESYYWLIPIASATQELDIGTVSVDGATHLGVVSDYFGAGQDDASPAIAIFPAMPVGGGPWNEWISLASDGGAAILESTPWQVLRWAFEVAGAMAVIRELPRAIRKAHGSRVRKNVRSFTVTRTADRRLRRYLGSRSKWQIDDLADRLRLSYAETSQVLIQCGFEVDMQDFRTWTKRARTI